MDILEKLLADKSTVVLGSAHDIVTHCGAPRFHFTDFPLGNPCGVPYDAAMQERIVRRAMRLFEEVAQPGTVVVSDERWSEDESWRQRYAEVRPEQAQALREAGEARRRQQAAAKTTD